VWLEELDQFEKSNDIIGNPTRDLPACSIVPQPTMLPRDPFFQYEDQTVVTTVAFAMAMRLSSLAG
jgi:hypothetical protein